MNISYPVKFVAGYQNFAEGIQEMSVVRGWDEDFRREVCTEVSKN